MNLQKIKNKFFTTRLGYHYWLVKTRPMRKHFPVLNILSMEKTIDAIVNNKMSISRFGDGEFKLILKESGIVFQNLSDKISKKLFEVLNAELPNLIVALPEPFRSVKKLRLNGKIHWVNFINKNGHKIAKQISNSNRNFGNAFISRFYMEYADKSSSIKTINRLKKIWQSQDILFVEGNTARLGIGNDLFSNANTIKRIICPAENAFEHYDEILLAAKKHGANKLIIIALGPTATILAYDLAKSNYWALDLGHIDVEYMWFKMKAEEKTPIYGKKSAEIKENKVIPIPKEFKKEYEESIVLNLSK